MSQKNKISFSEKKLIDFAYDSGFETGKKYSDLYRSIKKISSYFSRKDINRKEIINNFVESSDPYFVEELKGLSEGCNIPIEKLLIIQKTINNLFKVGCTTTLSTGAATKNNETFLTQNFDLLQDLHNYVDLILVPLIISKCKITRDTSGKYNYAFWGIPILFEIPIMNDQGLAFGGNSLLLTKDKSRFIDEGNGMSIFLLERLSMMTCKNVQEVADLWKKTTRAFHKKTRLFFWDGATSCWCDKKGEILIIEQTHNHFISVFGDSQDITNAPKDILWHTNHHQWLDPEKTGSIKIDEGVHTHPSFIRANRAREILEENYGNVDLNVCKKIVRDHHNSKRSSYSICCHPDKNYLAKTIFSWISMPKKMHIYWTRGSPCEYNFKHVDLSKKFDGN